MLTKIAMTLVAAMLTVGAVSDASADTFAEDSRYPLANAYTSCATGRQFEGYNCAELAGSNAYARSPIPGNVSGFGNGRQR